MPDQTTTNKERVVTVSPGAVMLPIVLAMLLGGIACLISSMVHAATANTHPHWPLFIVGLTGMFSSFFLFPGFFTLQPNEARVLILFGRYVGTVRHPGFHWGNPFYSNSPRIEASARAAARATAMSSHGHGEGSKKSAPGAAAAIKASRFRVSLRVRNMNSDRLKVNDNRGNPIEIAAVIVWRVYDTAQAIFDVDDYENYVRIQSEPATRHLASSYAYDYGEESEFTLRGGADVVAEALRVELQNRLAKAGVTVEEARITH